jgi:predicted O-methyltransferase YrrM
VLDVSRLRPDVPQYDTPQLAREWQEALEVLTRIDELGIPCAMSIGTRRILFQTIRAMGATDILDIGTFTGTSAATFALASGENGRVTTVDIQDANAPDGHWSVHGRPRTPMELIAQVGAVHRVEFVTQDSVEYLKGTARLFDFISIDGWHEDFCVYAEIELAMKRLKSDGLIFMDDVQFLGYPLPLGHDRIPGPLKAIWRHLDEGAPLKLNPITRSLEGSPLACAFLTRA